MKIKRKITSDIIIQQPQAINRAYEHRTFKYKENHPKLLPLPHSNKIWRKKEKRYENWTMNFKMISTRLSCCASVVDLRLILPHKQ